MNQGSGHDRANIAGQKRKGEMGGSSTGIAGDLTGNHEIVVRRMEKTCMDRRMETLDTVSVPKRHKKSRITGTHNSKLLNIPISKVLGYLVSMSLLWWG